jgi:Mor family transcriptional regulator
MSLTSSKQIENFSPAPESAILSNDLQRAAEVIDEIAPGRGKEIVVRLAREFSGTYVYFLQEEKLFRAMRDQWIIAQYDAGHRVADIARAVSLCERQVWNILGREPGEDKQLKLFK